MCCYSVAAFQPLVNSTTSHHLTLMACAEPASQSLSWKCNSQTACRGESARLFGWSRDAPFFKLLPGLLLYLFFESLGIKACFFLCIDVSFKVTQFKYIVMNIHYAHPVNRDNSGLAITTTDKPFVLLFFIGLYVLYYCAMTELNFNWHSRRKYEAGILTMATNPKLLQPKTKSKLWEQFKNNYIYFFV
jgi:hypothetical protein